MDPRSRSSRLELLWPCKPQTCFSNLGHGHNGHHTARAGASSAGRVKIVKSKHFRIEGRACRPVRQMFLGQGASSNKEA